MSLRATAVRLAQQLGRLPILLWDFWRGYRAARTRSAAETRKTAIHEAGHAVLMIALGLSFVGVSIIPDVRGGTLGQVYWSQVDFAADPRCREAIYLSHAMVCYAGAEAVRQLIPTDPYPDAGASHDKQDAAKFIRHHIGGDADSIALLFSLAKRRCALLVEHYQPEIEALAGALETKLMLSARDARSVFVTSLTGRAGRPLTFKTDPTVDRPASDEAFRAFLRKLNLPPRAG